MQICGLLLFVAVVIWLSVQEIEYIPIVILGIAALIIFVYPIIGLLTIVALIPLETVSIFDSSMTLIKLLGVWTLLSFLTKQVIIFKRPIFLDEAFWLFITFLSWALLSLLWAGNISAVLIRFLTLLQLVGLYILIINMIDSEKKMNWIIAVFIIGTVICGFFTIRAYLIEGSGSYSSRMVLRGGDPNIFGAIVGVAMFSTWYFIRSRSARLMQRVILTLILIGLSLVFIFTQSRGAWVGFIVSLSFYLLFFNQIKAKKILSTAIFASLLFITISSFSLISTDRKDFLKERFLTIFHPFETTSFAARIFIWKNGYEMWERNPLLGVGLNNFHLEFPGFSGEDYERDPHNSYLGIACELGVIGLLIWGVIMLYFFRTILRNPNYSILTLTLFVLVLVLSLSGTYYYSKLQWLVFGFIGVSSRIKDEERSLNFDKNFNDDLPEEL